MRKDLEAHARRMAASYGALVVVLLLILGALGTAMVVGARACRQVPTELLVGAAAAVAAILEIVRRTVGEWIKAKFVVTLCRRLDAVQLDSVINRLLK